jgi:ABC-2 type transport system ATP-binding protein
MAEQLSTIAIEARGLRKVFDYTVAVDGLDLTIATGEIFGLVGPDGAGKTTTMRMLCGVLRPSGGWAGVAGFDVMSQAEEVKQRIGYVPQRFSLYPELTVDENLLFQARVHGVVGKLFEERRERLLSFSRLGRFRNRPTQDLSGGMAQKLALSCALIHRPEVLLLDEPTTGVDPISRGEFWELLLGLAEEKMTVLVTTPYMDEAERCRRVGLLYEGRLLVCGTPLTIRRQAQLELLQVTCGRAQEGRAALRTVPGVRWVEIFGDRLHVAVERAEQEATVRRALEGAGIKVVSLRQIEAGLEDAFFELVRRKREELG